jgi:hypothetical protein
MTVTTALIFNAALVAAVLAALAYVCWIPFRLPSEAKTDLLAAPAADEQAERYAA